MSDLWQSIAKDERDVLKAIVKNFIGERNYLKQDELMDQLLYKWTNSEAIKPDSRGGNIEARQLAVLECIFGENFSGLVTTSGIASNPNPAAAEILKKKYKEVKNYYYSLLMIQTHGFELFSEINFTWDEKINVLLKILLQYKIK